MFEEKKMSIISRTLTIVLMMLIFAGSVFAGEDDQPKKFQTIRPF